MLQVLQLATDMKSFVSVVRNLKLKIEWTSIDLNVKTLKKTPNTPTILNQKKKNQMQSMFKSIEKPSSAKGPAAK